ncbi:uncharacterized protein A4U43_C08F19810 [Asparagus officinalis]|uniref:protein PYRICULARIA ORYZAE RESISTANCE 21-like n=1 Tax=Asparagus officinalis TaxID=4686 RepID=UPI00098DE3A8|nr:protein PYRICULARIA ORYZAE RESISTANCE 21-like [Asparagus officinalis]ONK60554.1 uncharacterized protein A4U43_C08F19810 [Asparagus officinalis]
MAEKISTIILKVDLDCRRCYKKISKTICKLQEKEKIQTVEFDEKNNTVTISGPFNPKKLCKKLCCKACEAIKDIQIKEHKEKEKPKETKPAEPKKEKPKETKPAESTEPKKEKPKETKPAESFQPKKDKPKDEPKKEKPKALEPDPPVPEPVKAEPVFVAQEPELGYQPVWPGSGSCCGCGCRSWKEGYYGYCNCCWCGRRYGWPTTLANLFTRRSHNLPVVSCN